MVLYVEVGAKRTEPMFCRPDGLIDPIFDYKTSMLKEPLRVTPASAAALRKAVVLAGLQSPADVLVITIGAQTTMRLRF